MEIAERNGLGNFWIIRLGGVGIGFISIYDLTEKPFIFYAILSAYRNKGYMKRAIKMIENYGFSSLYTKIDIENEASLNVSLSSDIGILYITFRIRSKLIFILQIYTI